MKNYLFLLLGVSFLSGCSNEEFNDLCVSNNTQTYKVNSRNCEKGEIFKFFYKNKEYRLYSTSILPVASDSIARKIQDEISKKNNSGVFIYPNNEIEYFDTEGEFIENQKRIKGECLRQVLNGEAIDLMSNGDHMLRGPQDIVNNAVELYFILIHTD